MTLAAQVDPIRRVEAGVRPTRGLRTLAPTMLNRMKSSLSALRSASSSFRQVKLVPHTCCVPIAQSPPAGHAAVKAQFLRQQCCADFIVLVSPHAASNADQVFDGDMVLLAATNAGLSPSPRAAWAMP